MSDLRPRSPSNGVEKAIWASKIVFFLLGILSALRLAVPPAASALSSALPRLSASLCSCLAPPYLLVVINLIILLIWKLSDQRHHEEKPTEVADVVKIKPSEPPPPPPPPSPPAVSLSPDPTPLSWLHIPPSPEPDETPDPDSGDDGDPLHKAAESSDENDSMEATWKAIMEKTPRGGGTPTPAAIRARLPSATGREEWNQRFDDFIKKRHDQIRLQRHESNQRRLQNKDQELH